MCNVCVWKFEYPKRWAAIYPPCLGDFDPILQSRLLRERGFRSSKLLSGRTLESRKLYKFPYFRAPSNLGQLRTLRHQRAPPQKKKANWQGLWQQKQQFQLPDLHLSTCIRLPLVMHSAALLRSFILMNWVPFPLQGTPTSSSAII